MQERERIEQELQVARQIQQELLPETIPKLEDWQIATYYGPAREVGGDFYDFFERSPRAGSGGRYRPWYAGGAGDGNNPRYAASCGSVFRVTRRSFS